MAPKRMAVVDADGNVDNVILIEDGADWMPPDGMSLVEAGRDAEPGGCYAKGKFARAVAPAIEQPSLEERFAALAADVEALKSLSVR